MKINFNLRIQNIFCANNLNIKLKGEYYVHKTSISNFYNIIYRPLLLDILWDIEAK